MKIIKNRLLDFYSEIFHGFLCFSGLIHCQHKDAFRYIFAWLVFSVTIYFLLCEQSNWVFHQ